MITILHLNHDTVGNTLGRRDHSTTEVNVETIKKLQSQGHYTKVADVVTDDLHRAYMLTSKVVKCWNDNINVICADNIRGFRSTSIGDILIHNDVAFVIGHGFSFVRL